MALGAKLEVGDGEHDGFCVLAGASAGAGVPFMVWSEVCVLSLDGGRTPVGRPVGKGGGPPIGACGKSAAESEGCDIDVVLIELVNEVSIDASNLVSEGGDGLAVDVSGQLSVEELV